MKGAAEKLGLRPGLVGWALGGALEGFDPAPEAGSGAAGAALPDVILAYATDRAALERLLPELIAAYRRGKALWIAYPKRSSRVTTDLTRDTGWAAVQAAGLLPVSQVSVDSDWTAIRLRFRDEIRTMTRKADWPGMG